MSRIENSRNIVQSGGTTGLVASGLTSGTGGAKDLKKNKTNFETKRPVNHQISKINSKNTQKIMKSEENDESDRFVNINASKIPPIEEVYSKQEKANPSKFTKFLINL